MAKPADFSIELEGWAYADFVDSYGNTQSSSYGAYWTPNDGVEFNYVERYHHKNDLAFDLKGHTLNVTSLKQPPPQKMLLSCGDQTVMMTSTGNGSFTWPLSQSYNWGKTTACIIDGMNLMLDMKGVVQMTLQPLDGTRNGNRSILIGFGPESWPPTTAATQILASNLPGASSQLGDDNFWVGGLAQYFIENGLRWDADYDLIIDQEIRDKWAACSLGVALTQGDGDTTVKGVLDVGGKWRVYSQNPSCQLNGFNAFSYPFNKRGTEAQRKICTGLLDISTTYQATGDNNDFAIDVAGVTFCYPGKRNEGSVQLNSWESFGWDGSTPADRYSNLRSYLQANKVKHRVSEFGAVKVVDTTLIGGWADASDGIETMGKHSYFDRNFIHTADDSIKLRAPNVSYRNTTVWQGDVGAVINPSAYGYLNQSIQGCDVEGVYVHRVTHRFNPGDGLAQNDDLGALISNRTGFSDLYFEQNKNQLTLHGVTINLLYVPSIKDGNIDANSISRVIVISAVNPNSPQQGNPNKNARLGFYPVPTARFVNQVNRRTNNGIQIALGTQDSPFILTNFKVNFPMPPQQKTGYVKGAFVVGDINDSQSWHEIDNPPCCSIPYAYNRSGVQSKNDQLIGTTANLVAKNVRWKKP